MKNKYFKTGYNPTEAEFEKDLKELTEEAVRGFWKWLEQFPLVIGVNAEGDEPDIYLSQQREKE